MTGRPLTTTTANGPDSAGGTALALHVNSRSWLMASNTFQNPLSDTADVLPFPNRQTSLSLGIPGATATLLPAVAPFSFYLDHLAHAENSQSKSLNSQFEIGTGGVCGDGQSVHGERSFVCG